MLAEHLGDREDEVRRGGAFGELAGQLEADDARDEHRDRLSEHRCLSLDTAHTPTNDAQAVDHGGVRVGADAGVRVGLQNAVDGAREDHACKVLDVDLVDDAGARGDDLEVVECGLAPAEELVALAVALVFDVGVLLEGIGDAEHFGDHRVVDDHLGWRQRVDLRGIAAEILHGLTHGGEVDDARNTGEVLHDDAGRGELDFVIRLCIRVPVAEELDVFLGDVCTILGAQEVLKQDLQAERQLLRTRHGIEPENFVGSTVHIEACLCPKAVDAHRSPLAVSHVWRQV